MNLVDVALTVNHWTETGRYIDIRRTYRCAATAWFLDDALGIIPVSTVSSSQSIQTFTHPSWNPLRSKAEPFAPFPFLPSILLTCLSD